MGDFTLTPTGTFSLRESVEFGFGQRHSDKFDGVMRLAFVTDDLRGSVGVSVTQDGGRVHGEVVPAPGAAAPDPAAVGAQVARILSLDHDVAAFEAVGDRDPVVRALQDAAPGLLPPLFHSPYEAAFWSVLSARRPAAAMMKVRDALAHAHGTVFPVSGRDVAALPTPRQFLAAPEFPGIPQEKWQRLRGVAHAAERGDLDVRRLQRTGPEGTVSAMQQIKGIGPFYASLIAIRAVGFTDVLPVDEPMVREAAGRLYGLGHAADVAEFTALAEPWRPFRTWVSVLLRAAGDRVGDRP